jgi:SAM-dependent methyltransferase
MGAYKNIADLYHWEYKNWLEDINFYLRVLENKQAQVLELACGTGRVACAIALEGFSVTGIDTSLAMLRIAKEWERQLTATRILKVNWIQGDMSRFQLSNKYEYILIPFSSFAFLTSKERQERCLEHVRNHITEDGIFILDLFAPNYEEWATQRTPMKFVRTFFAEGEKGYLGLINKFEQIQRDPYESVMKIDMVYETYYYNDSPVRVETTLELAMFTQKEIQHLLEKMGFVVTGCFGNYRGEPYDRSSSRMIFISSPG